MATGLIRRAIASAVSSRSTAATTTLSSSASSVAVKYDDEEEEEDVCRICGNLGDADNPLRYPCACSGSIKFVHQDCLLQWLNHSNVRQCESADFCLRYSRRVEAVQMEPSVYPALAPVVGVYSLPQQLFPRDAQTITAETLESVKAALANSEIEQKAEAKKKAIPRKAAGQAWEDPTLAE